MPDEPAAGDAARPADRRQVRTDCRHYVMQTVSRPSGADGRPVRRGAVRRTPSAGAGARVERVERCRLGANQPLPFACPPECLFYEPRSTSSAGWSVDGPARD